MFERRFVMPSSLPRCASRPNRPDWPSRPRRPRELRSLLEGTWELVEWHVDGEVLRPPQAGGRWLNHDGVVVATFHRETAAGFESFVGYGTYEMDASNWSYTYERIQTASGPSSGEADGHGAVGGRATAVHDCPRRGHDCSRGHERSTRIRGRALLLYAERQAVAQVPQGGGVA